jgi:hypothetical protein
MEDDVRAELAEIRREIREIKANEELIINEVRALAQQVTQLLAQHADKIGG